MRNILAICRRELLSFFVSPIAYVVITGFVLLAGYFFFNLLSIFSVMFVRFQAMASFNPGAEGPNLNQWVVEPFYFTLVIILVFLVPVLTMRLLAEERKRGTFELLITSPLSVMEIVLGKFLGVAGVLFVMCTLCFAFPLLLVYFGQPGPELYPVLSGWLGLFLCSLAFASIALAVSAFTENQIVAAVSGIVALLLLYVIHSPAEALEGTPATVLKALSPVLQMQDLVRGVISIQSLAYFGLLVILGLFLSQRAIDAQRFR
jgi:ABC-2 type transport system permease protein